MEEEWYKFRHPNSRDYFDTPNIIWKRFYCDECEEIVKERQASEKKEYIRLKIQMMYERALTLLERQIIDFNSYEQAIKAVEEFARENPSKFDSSYEMIAAVILINEKISAKLQYKIGNYRVDFYLPKLKCILEVDGERHKHKLLEDSNRDIKIRQTLGPEWEVVRIPVEYLEKNARVLPKAIIELKKEKQKIRNKNAGIIPSYYSKRDKAKVEEVEKIANKRTI